MEEATTRQRWLLAAGLSLALLPARLVDLAPARPPPPRAAVPEVDPMQLALAAPDLVGPALRLEVAPRFERPAPPPEPQSLRAAPVELVVPETRIAKRTPEPELWVLLGLSLASAAGASRGTRRCPRWRRAR